MKSVKDFFAIIIFVLNCILKSKFLIVGKTDFKISICYNVFK